MIKDGLGWMEAEARLYIKMERFEEAQKQYRFLFFHARSMDGCVAEL